MSRLTIQEVIEHCERTVAQAEERKCTNSKLYWEHKQVEEWLKELQKYKDLEEQGRLIELPCKVGEKIYSPINNHIIEFIVIGLIYDIIKDRWSYETAYQSGTDWRKGVCDFGLIGEIVFLTLEEAEEKLKEMRGVE